MLKKARDFRKYASWQVYWTSLFCSMFSWQSSRICEQKVSDWESSVVIKAFTVITYILRHLAKQKQ